MENVGSKGDYFELETGRARNNMVRYINIKEQFSCYQSLDYINSK